MQNTSLFTKFQHYSQNSAWEQKKHLLNLSNAYAYAAFVIDINNKHQSGS